MENENGESGGRTPRSEFSCPVRLSLVRGGTGREAVRLFGGGHLRLDHRHIGAVVALGDELHRAGLEREEGMVATYTVAPRLAIKGPTRYTT